MHLSFSLGLFSFLLIPTKLAVHVGGWQAEALAEELATLYYAFRFINLDLRSL